MITRSQVEKFIPSSGSNYDVIVAGGGPAGLGAALASAKMGARTLLLEARSFFGGVAATSLWMPLNRLLLNQGTRGGVHEIIVAKIKSYGPDASLPGRTSWVDGDGLHIHPEYLRLASFELLEEAGCHYRLYSPVTDVVVDGNEVKAVITTTKEGNIVFSADVFIDCTGDGDLSYKAGAETEVGRPEDGALMAVTLGFALTNIDTEKFFAFFSGGNSSGNERLREIINQAEADGYSCSNWYSFDRTTLPGVVSVNNGGLRNVGTLDTTHVQDASIAERVGIQVAHDFVKIARKYMIPGMEACYLDRVGACVGVRETRRVKGDYILTIDDAIGGCEFDDVIARRYGAVDLAGLKEDKDYTYSMKSGYAYPYRGLLVYGIERLLVAGRCGSYTHLGMAAGKSMGNMIGLGQAAGVAAALASQLGMTPRQLDVKLVQQALRDMGVTLEHREE